MTVFPSCDVVRHLDANLFSLEAHGTNSQGESSTSSKP